MKKVILLSGLAMAMVSCDMTTTKEEAVAAQPEPVGTEQVVVESTKATAHDWYGTYEGTLPCASCPGIETTVELKDDNTYEMKSVYLEKDEDNFDTDGIYEYDEAKKTVTLKSEDKPVVFAIENNQLRMLDTDGNKVTGEMEKNYILLKK